MYAPVIDEAQKDDFLMQDRDFQNEDLSEWKKVLPLSKNSRKGLLLDEATSALDQTTEQHLLENLRAMTDKTVVIVTHRGAARDVCEKCISFSETTIVDK